MYSERGAAIAMLFLASFARFKDTKLLPFLFNEIYHELLYAILVSTYAWFIPTFFEPVALQLILPRVAVCYFDFNICAI